MKTEQMPERIAILTPSDMDTVDPSQFYVTAPCPGGEYGSKATGRYYAEYVRADAVTALARSDGALEKRHIEQMAATLLSGLMATADKTRLAPGAASESYIDWAIEKAKKIRARNT